MERYRDGAMQRLENYLIENVPTGKAKRARSGGIPQRVSPEEAKRIRAAAKAPKVSLPEPKEREKRKGVQAPSRGIKQTERELRGKRYTPAGLASRRASDLKARLRDPKLPMSDYINFERRIASIKSALKNKKSWGDDVEYVLDYLLSEGLVDSYEDGIYMIEFMSSDFLSGILLEGKKKVDQDMDGDNDFADVMIARMVAAGIPKGEAIRKVKNKDYNF